MLLVDERAPGRSISTTGSTKFGGAALGWHEEEVVADVVDGGLSDVAIDDVARRRPSRS